MILISKTFHFSDSTDGNGFNSNGGRMAPGTITFQNTDAMIKVQK